MSDPDAHRKTPRRWWLFAPYVALCLGLAVATMYWWWARSTFDARLTRESQHLRREGYAVDLDGLRFSGWPYRLEAHFSRVRVRAPSGWGASAKTLTAGANLYDLGHWVAVAGEGLTITRPEGGDIAIVGDAIRASFAGLDASTPRIAVEGVNLRFQPAANARPFSLADAARIEVYTRPSADRTAAEALIRFDGVSMAPGTALSSVTRDRKLSGAFALRMTRIGAWKGQDWASSGRAWSKAGGRVEFDPTAAPSADVALVCDSGTLLIGEDGRPTGVVPLAFMLSQEDRTSAPLKFENGEARLGPLRLGPSPRLF